MKSLQICPCCKTLLEIKADEEGIKVSRESEKYEAANQKEKVAGQQP
jgi:DNA-directed RNA polymerase subunit M/transcription elongation factor TFIIS